MNSKLVRTASLSCLCATMTTGMVQRTGKVTQLKVVSRAGNPCKLKSPARVKVTNHQNRMLAVTPAENGTWTFATEAGGTYQVRVTEQEPKRN